MVRRQIGKGYDRRHQDRQLEREKHAISKAKKRGPDRLMSEVQELKEEVAMLEGRDRANNMIIHGQTKELRFLRSEIRHKERQVFVLGWLCFALVLIICILLLF